MNPSANTFHNMARHARHRSSVRELVPGRPNLLGLPWDIQRIIFEDVFREEGGYAFNSTSEKLVTASNSPINFSLMYSCRTIWNDTKHMPLSLNNISFSTFYTPSWRPWAGRFYHLCNYHRHLQTDLLFHLRGDISPEMRSEVDRKFPTVMPKLREELDGEYWRYSVGDWQQAPPGELPGFAHEYKSNRWKIHRFEGIARNPHRFLCATWTKDPHTCRQATEHTLGLVAEGQPEKFTSLIKKALPKWSNWKPVAEFLNLSLDLWDIPSRAKLAVLGHIFQDNNLWTGLLDWPRRGHVFDPQNYAPGSDCIGYQEKCRFSAAAVAISFIKRLPLPQRLSLRRVTLLEDKLSVNNPAFHGVGFIPLCQENPKLRIQRRLTLSQALLTFRANSWGESLFDTLWNTQRRLSGLDPQRWVSPSCLTAQFLFWIAEASRLPSLGMPADSYTLVLDGGPHGAYFSDFTKNVFLLFCGLALAYEKYKARNKHLFLPDPSIVWLSLPAHWVRALSVPIRLVSESSHSKQVPLIQSNFQFGTLPDVRELFNRRADWNIERWIWERNFCLRLWTAPYPLAFGRWQDNVLENYERQPIQVETETKTTKKTTGSRRGRAKTR
jgi:hypothetical protein